MEGFNQINFKSLKLFVAVLDVGSFSEVARREALSPSSVSRVIQQMEQALQTQLLYRNTRAVSPTESGKLLGHHARQVLDQIAQAERGLPRARSRAKRAGKNQRADCLRPAPYRPVAARVVRPLPQVAD
ncbi:DNA-binding transcriptional LysR family regulator [Ewingella americana]